MSWFLVFFPSRLNTKYKVSMAGKSLICSYNTKETIVPGESSAGRMIKDQVEIMGKSQITESLG